MEPFILLFAYELELHDEWEIAEALASCCMAYQQLGPINKNVSGKPVDPIVTIETLYTHFEIEPFQIHGKNVFHRIKK